MLMLAIAKGAAEVSAVPPTLEYPWELDWAGTFGATAVPTLPGWSIEQIHLLPPAWGLVSLWQLVITK